MGQQALQQEPNALLVIDFHDPCGRGPVMVFVACKVNADLEWVAIAVQSLLEAERVVRPHPQDRFGRVQRGATTATPDTFAPFPVAWSLPWLSTVLQSCWCWRWSCSDQPPDHEDLLHFWW